ncbi:MAG: hypothetical protein ACK452_08190, partial [Bacteroidota bacterium]
HKRGSFNSFLKNGFFFDKLNYNDSLKSINNNSKAITHISELELNYTFSNEDMFSFGINNTYCLANSDAYTKNAEQNYFSIFGNYLKKSFSGNNSTLISIRQEHTLGKFQPFTYSISNRYEIKKWLVLKLIYNKLYRLPTFNNLYWNPGGNPSLLPENGSSRDFQIETKTRVFSMNQIKLQANSNI